MPELDFKGKEFVRNHHLTVPYRPLVVHSDKSIGDGSLDDNLIIQGDNLHALKALLPKYAGKVDCIFIDPPYNTGNEGWSYNDNVNSPLMKEWLSSNPVNVEDMLRHDKWCCMMWPRLRLLHELLTESGSLWMTLDDNEVHRARCMLDEVFGSGNHVVTLAWQKRTSPDTRLVIGSAHDHVLCYSKGDKKSRLALFRPSDTRDESLFSNPDNDPRGPWSSSDMTAQGWRRNQMYTVTTPAGTKYEPPPGRCWSMIEDEYLKLRADKRIWFGIKGDARPRVKTFIRESEGLSDWSWWPHEEAGTNEKSKREINSIIGSDVPFETPKPVALIERIVSLATPPSGLVLDSFAGSGTTAHAVLNLNQKAKDGEHRRFILIECGDYADSLTAERVRRVIRGYTFKGTQRESLYEKKLTWTELKKGDHLRQEAETTKRLYDADYDDIDIKVQDGKLTVVGIRKVQESAPGIGGSFTYCTLGDPIDLGDILSGKSLPPREALGQWLLHTAVGKVESDGKAPTEMGELEPWYLATQADTHIWLLYKPDVKFLQSAEAALTLDLARKLKAVAPGKKHLVFGPAKYVSTKLLRDEKLPVEFASIPFSLFRLERD